jgi:ABC-type multidrug transport system ATPase subunit
MVIGLPRDCPKMLMGMLSVTSGKARVLGAATFVKQQVGYVPETHHFYSSMRVGEVIGFCRSLVESWNDRTCREMLCPLAGSWSYVHRVEP